MKIKKEITLSDVLAFLALIISSYSIWYNIQSNKGYIIQGGGFSHYTTIKENDNCSFVISIPIQFHNSGKKAVTLEQLTPPTNKKFIIFSNQNTILKNNLKYQIYMSKTDIGVIPSMWIKKIKSYEEFQPGYKFIQKLIKPNHSYTFFLILVMDINQNFNYDKLYTYINFQALFGNEQKIEIKKAIDIDVKKIKDCIKKN
jgi:hypothetical protein